MKKVLSMVLAVLIAAGSVAAANSPISAVSGYADEQVAQRENAVAPLADVVEGGTCGENLTWVLDSEGTLTISGTGNMDATSHWSFDAEIKSVLIKDGVTSIGSGAFQGCTSLTTVTIPDSVTSIGDLAFLECTSLTVIDVDAKNADYSSENGVLFKKDKTMLIQYPSGKTDTSYTIPDSVTSIDRYAFLDSTSLTTVTIPESVTSIGYGAFMNCSSLESVTIPDSVTSIGDEAFYDCTSLTAIDVDAQNAYYSSENGVLFNKGKTKLIQYPVGKTDQSYTIPGSVTSIGRLAFECCTILTAVTIPDSVTSIGDLAFADCTSLTTVTIPGNVTRMGYRAFAGCTNLITVMILDGVPSIEQSAFEDCTSLTTVAIPDSVTSIVGSAFEDCRSLTAVTIPDSVTSIGWKAFAGCESLTAVTIPNSVTSIGSSAFLGCISLTAIDVDAKNAYYTSENGALFNKDKTELIQYPAERTDTSYTIPDSVTSISGNAFEGCTNLTTVTIPNSVTSIGGSAFLGCASLTTVTIPDGVTSIGGSAFGYCTSLTTVTIPDGVTSIGGSAFKYCTSLTTVMIPNSVTSIGYTAFSECSSLESVTFNGTMAEWNAIEIRPNNEPLTNAEITCTDGIINQRDPEDPDVGTSFVEGDLEYTVLDDGTLEVSCPSDKKDTLTQAVIPSEVNGRSVTSIGAYAFEGCSSLTSVTIPDSVTSIGSVAFWGCSSLTSVTIPDSVTSIGDYAFRDCGSLEKIEVGSQNEDYSSVDGVLFNKDQTALICYPAGKKDTSYEIPDSVTSIGEYAFSGCSSLTSVTIPDSVTSIGAYAFDGCSSLTSVTIPDSVTSIGSVAFWGCSSLTSVTIPNSVTSIGGSAFEDCSSLTSVTLGNGVTSIDRETFDGCSSLTSVTIPNSVTSIGWFAFSGCSSLTSVTIPNSVTYISDSAFKGCSSLTSVTFNGTTAEWNAIAIYDGNEHLTSAEITCTDGIINPRDPDDPTEIVIPVEIKTPETGAPDTSNMTVAISGGEFSETLSIGEDGTVEIGDIADGEYTFTFSAKNCAPRAYDVTVSSGTVSGLEDGVELHLYGDIDGDGKVNMKDVGKANAHAKNTAKLSDYDLSVSDINGDGKINMQDVGLMNAHAKNTKSLW